MVQHDNLVKARHILFERPEKGILIIGDMTKEQALRIVMAKGSYRDKHRVSSE